jgi:hypothetical protein
VIVSAIAVYVIYLRQITRAKPCDGDDPMDSPPLLDSIFRKPDTPSPGLVHLLLYEFLPNAAPDFSIWIDKVMGKLFWFHASHPRKSHRQSID